MQSVKAVVVGDGYSARKDCDLNIKTKLLLSYVTGKYQKNLDYVPSVSSYSYDVWLLTSI